MNSFTKFSLLFRTLFALFVTISMGLRAGTLSADFTSAPGTAVGSAVIEDGVLKLTVAEVNQKGSFIFDELDPSQRIGSFKATFKVRIGGGTSRPAHGFSFVLADDLSLDTPFGEAGGDTAGLVISFDTIDSSRTANDEGNDPGDAPGVIIKLNGTKIGAKRADNLKTDDKFVEVSIQMDPDGTLDVVYDGVRIFDDFSIPWTPFSGNFAFGAATSELTAALNSNHWIADLEITTAPVSGPFVSSIVPLTRAARPDSAVQIELMNLSSPTVSMSFDGVPVAPTVAQSGNLTTVSYNPPGLLAADSTHHVEITYEESRVFRFNFTVLSYPTLPTGAALASTDVDTASGGFKVRVHQIATNQPNSLNRALAQLAGKLGANIADMTLADADKKFREDVINFEQNGFEAGLVLGGESLIPGLTPDGALSSDNIAVEITGFLELTEGVHTLAVHSDDGAHLTIGEDPRDATAIVLVNHAFGSSSGTFVVQQSGFYPFRLLWWQDIGAAHLDFASLDREGTPVLVNHRAPPGHIKAYRNRKSAAPLPPYVSNATPGPNETGISTTSEIVVEISEESAKVMSGSVQLRLDGLLVSPSISENSGSVTVRFRPIADFPPDSDHTIAIEFKDPSGTTIQRQWTFRTGNAAVSASGAVKGYWNFDNGNLKATVGSDLEFFDNSQLDHYYFGTTGLGALEEIPDINGRPAKILAIPFTADPDLERQLGLRLKHGIAPNGGGKLVNQWTMILDLYWVDEGRGFGTILRTHDIDQPIDGDMFWRASDGSYGKSCCSFYENISQEPGHYHANQTWARVVFAIDLAANPRVVGKYINGFKHRDDVTGDGNALDSRFALPPEIVLFQDGDDNEQCSAYISAIQIREGRMSDEEISALGGPSAGGIPLGNGDNPDLAGVQLTIARTGTNVSMGWPDSATGFVLEFTDDLVNPIWTPVPGVLSNSALVSVQPAARFYRLQRR